MLLHNEELEWLDTELEVLEADLVLNDLAFNMNQVAILSETLARIHDLVVAGSVWVIAITKAVLAVTTLDEHHVGTCVVNQLHLHVALTEVERARVEVVKAVSEVKLDIVVVDRLAQAALVASKPALRLLLHQLLPLELADLVCKFPLRRCLRAEKHRCVSEQVALVPIVKSEVGVTDDGGKAAVLSPDLINLHAHSAAKVHITFCSCRRAQQKCSSKLPHFCSQAIL